MTHYRRILLHAGLSKTGSTSIQANCVSHREVLAQLGICYPLMSIAGEALQNHSLPLVLALVESPARYIPGIEQRYSGGLAEAVQQARQQLDEVLAAHGDTLVLSSELLESFQPEDMAALRSRLAPHALHIDFLAYFRSPYESLSSLLQERLKAGVVLEPAELVGRVRRKYELLRGGFGEALLGANYHEASAHDSGLVGDFFERLGVPAETIAGLSFETGNERMSMECFRLMRAINRRYPRRDAAQHGVARFRGDLNVLLALPGEPFQLQALPGADMQAAVLAESAWLEQQLGFRFPDMPEPAQIAPPVIACQWQAQTTDALPALLDRLPGEPLKACAQAFLRTEATAIAAQFPERAQALLLVAGRP